MEEVLRRWLTFPEGGLQLALHLEQYPFTKVMSMMSAEGRQQTTRGGVFVHIDMDAFFCSVALSAPSNSHLRHLPVAAAVGMGHSEITSCNYVARSFGVSSGMYVGTARKTICPQLRVLPFDLNKCALYSERACALMLGLHPMVNLRTFHVIFGCPTPSDEEKDSFTSEAECAWAPLPFVLEVISVDDTMLCFSWPSSFLTLLKQSEARSIFIQGGVEIPVTSALENAAKHKACLESALYAMGVTFSALLRTQIISQCDGISASCGVGSSYLISRLATQHAKPNGTCVVLPVGAREGMDGSPFSPNVGIAQFPLWAQLTRSAQPDPLPCSWQVPVGIALQSVARLKVMEQRQFIDDTRVAELFGVGEKALAQLYSLFCDARQLASPSAMGVSAQAEGQLGVRTCAPLCAVPLEKTAQADDLAACLVVAGEPRPPGDEEVRSVPADRFALTCAAFQIVSLENLQSQIGRKQGVLLYCFCRGVDLRVLVQTGDPRGIVSGCFDTNATDVHRQSDIYRKCVSYLFNGFFARSESFRTSIATTMGYACRPHHQWDLRHIIQQLVEDVSGKVRSQTSYHAGDVSNGYEQFHNVKLSFFVRHPDYPREPTKYLGLGRCTERHFTVRIFVDTPGELAFTREQYSTAEFAQANTLVCFRELPPCTGGGHTGMKRARDGVPYSARGPVERSATSETTIISAVVIGKQPFLDRFRPVVQATPSDILDSRLNVSPESLGVFPLGLGSLQGPQATKADTYEKEAPIHYTPSTSWWVEAVTAALFSATWPCFEGKCPLSQIDILDIRGMSLSINGLRVNHKGGQQLRHVGQPAAALSNYIAAHTSTHCEVQSVNVLARGGARFTSEDATPRATATPFGYPRAPPAESEWRGLDRFVMHVARLLSVPVTSSGVLHPEVFFHPFIPLLLCQWARARHSDALLFLVASLERSLSTIPRESLGFGCVTVECISLVQSWCRLWRLADGPPIGDGVLASLLSGL